MITLSYLLTTRNKLASLQEVLKRLIANKQQDEEIVVADGASTDGTTEYLRSLLETGQIDQLISEPDRGESHGFNKCMMMARGELLKVITDDDFFFYPAIQEAKRFMLAHPEIDVLASNGKKKAFDPSAPLGPFTYDQDYLKWCEKKTPFAFCGLGLMLRKRSLPLTGLFDTSYVKVDAEFALRVTSGKAALAWYAGTLFIHIANPLGNTITKHERIYQETVLLDEIYFRRRPSAFARLKRSCANLLRRYRPAKTAPASAFDPKQFNALFESCEQQAQSEYTRGMARFLTPNAHVASS